MPTGAKRRFCRLPPLLPRQFPTLVTAAGVCQPRRAGRQGGALRAAPLLGLRRPPGSAQGRCSCGRSRSPKKLRLHDTRHTTATLLLAGGSDLYAVARLLRPGSQSDLRDDALDARSGRGSRTSEDRSCGRRRMWIVGHHRPRGELQDVVRQRHYQGRSRGGGADRGRAGVVSRRCYRCVEGERCSSRAPTARCARRLTSSASASGPRSTTLGSSRATCTSAGAARIDRLPKLEKFAAYAGIRPFLKLPPRRVFRLRSLLQH